MAWIPKDQELAILAIKEHRALVARNQVIYRVGTPQQQRIAALEDSRPWDFTPEEEYFFMNTGKTPPRWGQSVS